jgi:hypothetical protein
MYLFINQRNWMMDLGKWYNQGWRLRFHRIFIYEGKSVVLIVRSTITKRIYKVRYFHRFILCSKKCECIFLVYQIHSSRNTLYKMFKVTISNIRMGIAWETQNNIASFWSQGFVNIHGAFKDGIIYSSLIRAMMWTCKLHCSRTPECHAVVSQ